jgi:hypothetical protein
MHVPEVSSSRGSCPTAHTKSRQDIEVVNQRITLLSYNFKFSVHSIPIVRATEMFGTPLSLLDPFSRDEFFSPSSNVVLAFAPDQRNSLTRGLRDIATDFTEHETTFELRADMPGLLKEDIKVRTRRLAFNLHAEFASRVNNVGNGA